MPPTFPITVQSDTADAQFVVGTPPGGGPLQFGSNIYIIGYGIGTSDPSFTTVYVYKSGDQGITWTQFQLTGADPLATGDILVTGIKAGNSIWISYTTGTPGVDVIMNFVEFSTLTDAFGVPVVTAITGNKSSQGCSVYRPDNNSMVVFSSFYAPNPFDPAINGYIVFDILSKIATFFAPAGMNSPAYLAQGWAIAYGSVSTITHLVTSDTTNTRVKQFPLFLDNTIGAVQTLANPSGNITSNDGLCAASAPGTNKIAIGYAVDSGDDIVVKTYISASVMVLQNTQPIIPATFTSEIGVGYVSAGLILVTASDSGNYNYFLDPGTGFGAAVFLGVSSGGGVSISVGPVLDSIGFQFQGSVLFWLILGITPPPPVVTVNNKSVGGGGTYFPRAINKSLLQNQIKRGPVLRDFPPLSSFFLFPNTYDICLSRDFSLFNRIDTGCMACAQTPRCFTDATAPYQIVPELNFLVFNPMGVLALPDPTDGFVNVFSFRVPYGYDGMVLALYQQYTGSGFAQGSGDLIWKVTADNRNLKDMGAMTTALGSTRQLSPVEGGIRLYSGNLVKFQVSAPNVSGLLPPPGTGRILAGLHGYFYPRG